MIEVKKAGIEQINGIIQVCSDGYRDTYRETHTDEYIERMIKEFYYYERIYQEVTDTSSGWDGWYVAVEDGTVVGAIGGGLIGEHQAEVFVLYLDPKRQREGIGSTLLQALTEVQRQNGATEQWVSVAKGNRKGISFYEAKQFQFIQEQPSFANSDNETYVSLRYCRMI